MCVFGPAIILELAITKILTLNWVNGLFLLLHPTPVNPKSMSFRLIKLSQFKIFLYFFL